MESYKEHHVTWLENFYDLIVAIIVFQLSRDLNQNVSIYGFLTFVALFIPVVWSWIGVTFYSTRFETDDLAHRLLMLLQIAVAALMAVSVPDGLGKNSSWFALSYAIMRTILVIEYLRTRKHVPAARKLTTRYSIGFSIAAGIWFASIFVPPPFRLFLWIIGLGVDIGTPLLFARQLSVQFAPHIHHLPERFGSFTIIVLGISILGVVNGIADHNWTIPSIISAGLGLGIAFSLWWIYFDTVDGSEIRALRENKQIGIYVTWLYIHFPLIIAFTAFGVSIEHVVLSNQALALPSSEKWLLCISTFLCLFTLGIIQMTSAMTTNPISSSSSSSSSSANSKKPTTYTAAIYSIVAAIVVLAIGAILKDSILTLPAFLIGIMAIACTGQVILDVKRHPHHRFSKF
ncbi:MAG TPA: low temperature requirement protein A [Nitrososphaeraceae archaeon]|nr:low temperature requirement protein A [Nitrososphaeraceae archaeon]